MSYLLLRAVFIKQEILLLQSANDPCSVLLQDERVDGDEVNINLDYFIAGRGRSIRVVVGRRF